MKYFLALAFILIAGCSTSTAPVSPYAPGGQFYMATGTFVGTWMPIVNGNAIDTNPCTVVITEADSNVRGTIVNNSSGEIISVTGFHDVPDQIIEDIDGVNDDYHFYWTQFVSSMGDTGSTAPLDFLNGNGFIFGCVLKRSPYKDTAVVEIDCVRQ